MTNRRSVWTMVLTGAGLIASTPAASAQPNTWTAGTGDWFGSGNWSLGVPVAGQFVTVDNGGTTEITSGATENVGFFQLAAGVDTAGHLTISDGTLKASGSVMVGAIGSGSLTMSGAATIESGSLLVGVNSINATGMFMMNSGTLDLSSLVIGNAGQGTMMFESGTLDCSSLLVGGGGSSNGTLFFSDGDISCVSYIIGNGGPGLAHHSDGVTSAEFMALGNNPGGDGSCIFDDGSLTVENWLAAGWGGTGFFEHSNGDVTTKFLYVGWNSTGDGEYRLAGGTLTATSVQRGPDSAAWNFDFESGTLRVREFGVETKPFDLLVQNGVLEPRGGAETSFLEVTGNLTMSNASTLRLDVDGATPNSSHDQVRVDGVVSVAGATLDVIMGGPLADGNSLVIIENDNFEPVLGTFSSLPEGATFSETWDAQTYNFEITYVGGDGNDVVLAVSTCPPDWDGDGTLTSSDLLEFLADWAAGDGDYNGDGSTNSIDLLAFLAAFSDGC